jgi:P4 family phage/plasmid primase-like protien
LTLSEVLNHFEKAERCGSEYKALCPAHDDNKQSLSISQGDDGKILMYCHAECALSEIVQKAGLKMTDLFPENPKPRTKTSGKAVKVAEYIYRDMNGNAVFKKIRRSDKSFYWLHSEGGKWEKGTGGKTVPLYRAFECRNCNWLYLVEGEKDTDNMMLHELPAVSPPNGAGRGENKWHQEYNEFFKGKRVCIIQDNDAIGKEFAAYVAAKLTGTADVVKVLDLSKEWAEIPEKGDISDMMTALPDWKERLQKLAKEEKEFELSAEGTADDDSQNELAQPIPEQYTHLFDNDGSLLFDALTEDDFIGCENIYSKIYAFDTPAEINSYIMRLKKAAKKFKLAGAVEERASTYKSEALRMLRARRRELRREQTGQNGRDLSDFPYIIEHEAEQGDLYYTVSCPLLAEYIRQNCRYIIIHDHFSDHDRMFWYEGGVYKPITDSILQGYIKGYITAFDLSVLKMRDVLEVMKDLKTDMRFVSENELNANEDIINFQNGLYSISDNRLMPHTPDIYSTIQIPCDYNKDSSDCPNFQKYLFELVNNDVDKANLLLEYMAACISNIKGYRMKKALFMYGKGNTGKSQAKALTEMLLGDENCAAGDLADLEERFGTSSLYQKRLYGAGDMSFVGIKELKKFKNVTGGDDILLEFKGKNSFPFKYKGLLWFCTNELPSFGGDRGDWVYDRIIPFECKNVIPKSKQDKHLLDKMFAEREAIISTYLIPALQRLIDNGYNFTLPNNVLDALESYKDRNSPVRTFYKECCIMRNEYTDGITGAKLFKVFKAWYSDNMGRACGYSMRAFKGEIAEALGLSVNFDPEIRRNNGRFLPLTLNKETMDNYEYFLK